AGRVPRPAQRGRALRPTRGPRRPPLARGARLLLGPHPRLGERRAAGLGPAPGPGAARRVHPAAAGPRDALGAAERPPDRAGVPAPRQPGPPRDARRRRRPLLDHARPDVAPARAGPRRAAAAQRRGLPRPAAPALVRPHRAERRAAEPARRPPRRLRDLAPALRALAQAPGPRGGGLWRAARGLRVGPRSNCRGGSAAHSRSAKGKARVYQAGAGFVPVRSRWGGGRWRLPGPTDDLESLARVEVFVNRERVRMLQ